jgi:DNA polymerase-3 subunit alpha
VRGEGGPFRDLFDFLERVDPRQVNRRTLETLARAGAFDTLHSNRAQIAASADVLCAHGQSLAAERASAQTSLFGDAGSGFGDAPRPRLTRTDDWTGPERLDQELAAVGFYLTGHPLDDVTEALRKRRTTLLAEALVQAEEGHEAFRMAGVVRRKQERSSARTGEKFAFVTLSDPTGEYEVLFPPESLRRCRDVLEPGKAVVLKVRAKAGDGEVRFFGDDAEGIEQSLEAAAGGLRVHVSAGSADAGSLKARLERATAARGGEILLVAALDGGREVEVKLPGLYRLDPSLRGALKSSPGVSFLEDV